MVDTETLENVRATVVDGEGGTIGATVVSMRTRLTIKECETLYGSEIRKGMTLAELRITCGVHVPVEWYCRILRGMV
jgi:hypothetical protein